LLNFQDITDKAYIVNGAIEEIKDYNTRQSLQVLPYDLVIRQPSAESIKHGKIKIKYFLNQITVLIYLLFKVSDFSKKTGDYASLSAVDIQLIALAYELCRENNDFKNLTKPDVKYIFNKKLNYQK
jgi:RNA-binding protein NOB1